MQQLFSNNIYLIRGHYAAADANPLCVKEIKETNMFKRWPLWVRIVVGTVTFCSGVAGIVSAAYTVKGYQLSAEQVAAVAANPHSEEQKPKIANNNPIERDSNYSTHRQNSPILVAENKPQESQTTKPRTIIGKKIVVSVGGEEPKSDPNEIVGESTIVHIPDSEVGKYDRVVGEEINLIVGPKKEEK